MALATSLRFKLLGDRMLPAMLGPVTSWNFSSHTRMSHSWPRHVFLMGRVIINLTDFPACHVFILFFLYLVIRLETLVTVGSIIMYPCLRREHFPMKMTCKYLLLARFSSFTVGAIVDLPGLLRIILSTPSEFTRFDSFIL